MQIWFYCDKCGCLLEEEEAAISCSTCTPPKPSPINIINVEFRSDVRRIADLEGRIAELERRLEEHTAHPVVTWAYGLYAIPTPVDTINWTCP